MTVTVHAEHRTAPQSPRTPVRRQRLRAVAGLAAVTLALGALTACGDEEPAKSDKSAGTEDNGAADDSADTADDGDDADSGQGADDDGADSGSDYFTLDDVAVWEDSGLEISVEAVSPYTPGEWALLENEDYDTYKVDFALTNNGDERISTVLILPTGYDENGIEAARVYDGDIGMGFQENVDPGVTVTAEYAFEVPPGSTSFTVEIGDLMTEAAVWKFDI
ncbi:DUF4352 domain-containing protein [Streptomyces harbinensis]|uniref:DUF4352 domain-containing protein n=1 Tax=Streptomyces harbinensis TaxID=1176198 RepID=UPI0015928E09|nr:DUF4352 domain-containing protein [Streptomyces harbinensis]QKV69410.1 DUF4352 domain-containing protein [Streptomyces harbinensis]